MKWNIKQSYIYYFAIFAIALGIDQITKFYFQSLLENGNKIQIIPSFLELVYVENRGAAFGAFQGGMFFFIIISLVVVATMTYYVREVFEKKSIVILFAVIAAGAIGNMMDRLIRGFVVDFIYFPNLFGYSFPVFNIADIFLCCGLSLLVIFYIISDRKKDA